MSIRAPGEPSRSQSWAPAPRCCSTRDGLIERRDSDLDIGLDRLRAALTELAPLALQPLCDQLLERLVQGRPADDVALVAIRLYPEQRS